MKAAKRHAVATGRTLTELIEDAVRVAVAPQEATVQREPVELPTSGSGGILPGVDLDDSASLIDLMEDRT